MSFYIEWNDYLKINVKKIDDEHKKIADIANELYNGTVSGLQSKEFEGKILKDLFEYSNGHFITEETLMKNNGYSDFENHKKEHDNYTSKLADLYEKHSGGISISDEMLELMKNWIIDHILKADRDLGIYLNSIGIE